MRRHGTPWAVLAMACTLSTPAVADPFCVTVQGLPDQCIYADGASCGKRAAQLGGECTANRKEVSTPTGPGKFCLVASGRPVECVFADRNTCNADAARRNTTCVPAEGPVPGSFDPFAPRRPY